MVNIAKQKSKQDSKHFIRNAFERVHRKLLSELEDAEQTVSHDGTRGSVSETSWIKVLRNYLPNRYAVASGIIIDCEGHTSDQIDVVIYDLQYTPVLLTQEPHQYIPAEAVYAVLEAKPAINKGTLEYAGKKAASVRSLKRTSVPIIHAGGTFPAKALFPIVSCIVAQKVDWKDGFGGTFNQLIGSELLSGDHRVDCGCGLSVGSFDFFDDNRPITIGTKSAGLVFFLFRLLNKLQSLGTVPAIDWNAYADVLKKLDSQQ